MYDITIFPGRLRELRLTRWEQYKEYQRAFDDKDYNKLKQIEGFKKYDFCKSQELFAEKLNIERRSICRWEKDKIPSIDNIIEICKILDCSIDYLLGSSDVPDVDPISKASKYSGISPEIIRYGKEHSDYLECLNYFMLPENCKSIFNSVTLLTWKKYWINSTLNNINSPLKEQLIEVFNEYNAITPFSEINKTSFKDFLKTKFPPTKTLLVSQKTDRGTKIKGCIEDIDYSKFFVNKAFDYETFINYITEKTFEPLSYNAIIEIQKSKLATLFINLFTQYLEELD